MQSESGKEEKKSCFRTSQPLKGPMNSCVTSSVAHAASPGPPIRLGAYACLLPRAEAHVCRRPDTGRRVTMRGVCKRQLLLCNTAYLCRVHDGA